MSTTTCRGATHHHRAVHAVRVARELPCRSGDADLWFAEAPADLEHAKQLCGSCPIRRRCLEKALDRAEPWGVWGGEILDQGRIVARKRGRGRPRKHPVPACA
ncbi:WhiB family transcriptional regulator [Rhodococcus rhodnii]|uniref:Transcriptional regulator WhiB n=1 Tax=Rhodococcus rhodnii TaxID=38312 RepID=A0A6P2CF93_9NOCA|nr:WhiB family transcriptional regulator [Rhodococcus rhodnii]TXG90620.1 WhiB family transcriptional regulator [Rhodococcus rhodnii]